MKTLRAAFASTAIFAAAGFATGVAPLDLAIAQPSRATLTGITVAGGGAAGTRVVLTFGQTQPPFSISDNDSERPTLAFASAVRGGALAFPALPNDMIKAIEINQEGPRLTVSIVGQGPIDVTPTPLGGNAVSLLITPTKVVAKETPSSVNFQLPQFVEAKPGEDAFEVVPLKYADVSEVVGLLSGGQPIKPNDNFTPQEPAFGSSSFNASGTNFNNAGYMAGANGPMMPSAFTSGAPEVVNSAYGQTVDETIGVDRRLNAIILRGSPERVRRLKEKIALLDVPVQSVLLETVFVELTETGARNLGFDFNNTNGQIAVATFHNGGDSRGPGYAGYSLQAALYAQVQKGEGRIVSRPQISAQSGSSAKIVTGDAVPILTTLALAGVNAVSQQVQYVNVGVTLQIMPRVSIDGNVTSHIFAEVSAVTGYSQGYPNISQREASTSATVKDGDYFIIGGLTQEHRLAVRGRVPGLGDIPIVGDLLKLHQESESKTALYIIVTPHIANRGDLDHARAEAAVGS